MLTEEIKRLESELRNSIQGSDEEKEIRYRLRELKSRPETVQSAPEAEDRAGENRLHIKTDRSQTGVIGDNVNVSGGIHFHQSPAESPSEKEMSPPPLEPTDRTALPVPCSWFPKYYRMPYRSLGSRFINKVRNMWEVHDILKQGRTAVVEGVGVVMGMGGLGKT